MKIQIEKNVNRDVIVLAIQKYLEAYWISIKKNNTGYSLTINNKIESSKPFNRKQCRVSR
jgi:hypothetical protein